MNGVWRITQDFLEGKWRWRTKWKGILGHKNKTQRKWKIWNIKGALRNWKQTKNWKWRQAQLWKGLYMPFEGGGAWFHLKEGIPLEFFFFFLNKGSRIYLNFYLFYGINMVLRFPLGKNKKKHLEYRMKSSENAEILERWLIIIQFNSVQSLSHIRLCNPMNRT